MKHNRGEPKNYENIETQKLDVLARILCKGVYTSVVKHKMYPDIYVTYPVGKYNHKAYSLEKKDIQNLQRILTSSDGKDKSTVRTELFNIAQEHQNSFISRMKQKHDKSVQKKLRNNEITQAEHDQQLAIDCSEIYKNDFLSGEDIDQLLSLKFNDSHHPRTLKKVPNQNIPKNVHTEAVGVHYLSTTEKSVKHMSKEYLIGLGNKSGLAVGCCAGCTKEFTILEWQGYTIERTRDFPHNLPINNYKPSPSISADNYDQFITEDGTPIPIMGYVHNNDVD